jgi:hypothetical protein
VNAVKQFALFWYDFVIGDDWIVAAGVVAAIAAVYGLHRDGVGAWWLLPPVIVALLALAVVRANRRAS